MEVALFNRQRAVVLPVERLGKISRAAARSCVGHPGAGVSVLDFLPSVEISIVSDRVMAKLHREFLQVSGATDVITFPHGEIVISAATAARQARENDEEIAREVARYIVHGLLHLHGHEDAEPDDSAFMWMTQEDILNELWPVPRGG